MAAACVVVAWGLRQALTPLVGPGRIPFVTFFPCVAVAAWYGGLRPGVLATLFGGAAAYFSFIEPIGSFWGGTFDDAAALTAYVVGAAFIVVTAESTHMAKADCVKEIELRQRTEIQLATTLASIGDGVIVTDTHGKVTFLNAEAERLTGWTADDARGRALAEVFRIVNEDTRATVESPVDKALRTGKVVGLANHTILLTRDGRETPIDDSAAPIRECDNELFGVVLVFRDVGEQRAAQQVQARLAAIVEHSGDAILTKNLNGIINSWNVGAERLFGYTADEIIGKPVTTLFPADRLHEEEGILQRLREGKPYERFETVRLTKSGASIPVSVSISPIRNDEGRVVGASTIVHDISAIISAREAAETASRTKDEFLATLSHELRTPLNAVLGYATLMRMGDLSDAEHDEAVEIIERNARVQAQLIEDLLDMNRIISGKIQLDIQPTEPADVINAALNTVRPSAVAKDVELTEEVEPTGISIHADPARLQQVVWNLLSNAVKFTPERGRVTVTVARVDSQLEIRVSDTGQGISADFLPYVFDRFRQADATVTRRYGGLGLGLSIVRHLAELHGGRVYATSEGPNCGSTFTVLLPLVSAADVSVRPPVRRITDSQTFAAVRRINLTGVRALVVDDERDAAALVERTLQFCGASVVTVNSAREALEQLQAGRFDILISDISMPGEHGYSLIRRVRSLENHHRSMPAMALTAFARAEDRDRAVAAGFDLHVAKPIETAKLPDLVATLVNRRADDGGAPPHEALR